MTKTDHLPVIGVTAHQHAESDQSRISHSYTNSIEQSGGISLVIPNPGPEMTEKSLDGEYSHYQALDAILGRLDGLVLSGGGDPDPKVFGEEPIPGQGSIEPERDFLELALAKFAFERSIPVLGICRGMQIMNIALGGTNYQDIATQTEQKIKHRQNAPKRYPTHGIKVENGLLADILGKDTIRVNSFHHQAVKEPAGVFMVSARSDDGLIEAIEAVEHPFFLGTQWHPETLGNIAGSQKLFMRLIQEAINYREK